MSKPGTIYRINWQSFHTTTDLQCFIDISDNDNLIDDGDEATVIDLQGAGEPCTPSVIDNNENPHTVILAQQLTIKFNSTTQVNMSTFVRGSDQRWGVLYYLGTSDQVIFRGFLVSDDNSISEDFLYPPNVVTLTANDGLPLLKDVALVDADGNNPSGYHKISDYLSWALRKTGMDLNLFAAFNIKSVNDVSDISIPNNDPEHFFYVEYLDAKTFEKEIGVSVSCYEAIEIILKLEARIFQLQGAWWILRVDEVESTTNGAYVSKFDSSGGFVSNLGEIDFRKYIGPSNDIFFSQAATSVTATRATKSLRLNYKYELPLEIPCNSNFERGDLIDDSNPLLKTFELDCWTSIKVNKTTGVESSEDTATKYIERVYDANGFEIEKYAVVTGGSYSISNYHAIKSEVIALNEKDKFTVNFSWRMTMDLAVLTYTSCLLKFVGDSATDYYWTIGLADDPLDGLAYKWRTSPIAYFSGGVETDSSYNDYVNDWQSFSVSVDPMPESGKLYIYLYNHNEPIGSQPDTWFTDFSFEYFYYVNGSYNLKGQYHTCFQADPATGQYKKKIEDDIFMSDAPCRIFKGALHEFDGSNYILSDLFYNAAVFPAGPTDPSYTHKYGEIQLFDVWNQIKNEMRVIQATCQNVDLDKTLTVSGNTLPFPAHLISKWLLTDVSNHTLNKLFILLHFNQDHNTQAWSGVLREVEDTTVTKDYSNHDFKYIV